MSHIPVSSRYLRAITRSHTVAFRADVLELGGSVLASLDIVDGNITVERERANRRTGSVTMVDRFGTLTPKVAGDLLSPYGNEIALYRGIDYNPALPGTDVELLPVGVFGFSETSIRDAPDGVTISCPLVDRSARIAAARYEDWYKVLRDVEISAAIAALLTDRWPSVTTVLPVTDFVTVRTFFAPDDQSDPWRDAQELARMAGETLAFDVYGNAAFDVEGDAQSYRTYQNGPDAVLLELERVMSAEGTYNVIVATGEGTDVAAPVRAVVSDDDPNSPTYVGGNFGRRVGYLRSPLIKTASQANRAGLAELNLRKGGAVSVTWEQLADPALDVGEVITILRDESRTAVQIQVDSLTLPLSAAGTMSLSGRVVSEVG